LHNPATSGCSRNAAFRSQSALLISTDMPCCPAFSIVSHLSVKQLASSVFGDFSL
jgi:hypothetical protein